ncbi:hypothetical protein [Sulfurisphaera ohwakuensis]|uniref:Uncharacterized protein n=1 Tax=Sulfurisphaera ohwakuensis TaxID=69656 RepID=A0A650CDB9_SULOH|nr:hypothetical protein [Sulfurisphaera ohwakuensis]MBB5253640.1 hypothetical protein [Sulfurisphaera ohwakuensis]QGR15769.1 hypothetical protein D1869_00025 [Sulfurisphaera ohwakuensis]
MKSFLLFLLLAFPIFVGLLHASVSFTSNTFFAYNQTVIMTLPNGSITTIHEVLLQRIVGVYPNNTIAVNLTVYNVGQKYYLPSVISLSNSSFPTNLYYIPPPLLGKNVTRGSSEMCFVNYSNGLYVYESKSNIQGVIIEFFMWVNSSGIAVKVQTLQIGANLQLVSNATAVLWKSNYFDPSTHLPTFPGYTEAHVVSANLNKTLLIISHKLLEYILIAGVLGIIIILLFRK